MNPLRLTVASVVAACTLTACAGRTTNIESGGDVASVSEVSPVDNRTIPAGMTITTTLDQQLGTAISKAGDTFTATVTRTHTAQNGTTVIPAGAKIEGRVTATDASDHAADPALIRLAIDRIRFNGRSYPLAASIVQSSPVQTSGSSGSDRTRNVVIGGAVGAALGAILGGNDLDKIIIGGALGAAAGSVISLGTEMNATLPAGSQMTVRATQTTTLR